MHTDSVRTPGPPGQGLVPADRMSLVAEWITDDHIGIELWIDEAVHVGRLVAIPHDTRKAVLAAFVVDASGTFSVSWTGELDRPPAWQNAQRAIAHRRYSGPR